MSVRLRVAAVLATLAFPITAPAAEPAPAPRPVRDRADDLAALIDKHLAKDWEARGIVPAERGLKNLAFPILPRRVSSVCGHRNKHCGPSKSGQGRQ